MNVLILHGIGGHAGIHWQGWLCDELEKNGHYKVIMPGLPDSDHPDREEWLQSVKRKIKGIDTDNLIIVGHSLGVTTALDFIENSATPVRGLVAVSGFSDDYGSTLNSYFLKEKAIDFNKVNKNLSRAVVLFGNNDPYVTPAALQSLANNLGVQPTIIEKGGHINTESGFSRLPQVLSAIREFS